MIQFDDTVKRLLFAIALIIQIEVAFSGSDLFDKLLFKNGQTTA